MTQDAMLDPEPVEEALREEVSALKRVAGAAWDVLLPAYHPIPCRASMHDGILTLEAGPLNMPAMVRGRQLSFDEWLWRLLHRPDSCGPARPVLTGRGRVMARAQLAAGGPAGLDARIRSAIQGVKEVFLNAAEKGKGAPWPEDHAEEACGRLAALCEEAGWACNRRSDGRLMVGLEAGDLFRQAALRALDGGAVRAQVELAAAPAKGQAQCGALARLLLRTAGICRGVAGAAWTHAGAEVLGLEALLEHRPGAAELADVLAALSLGCQLCAREAEALGDQRISAEYVALQGGFAG